MWVSPLMILAAFVGAQPSWAQAPASSAQPVAPSPSSSTDRNANAPKGPALAEEPHGSGSVYEELDAVRREQKAKEQDGKSDQAR